MAVSYTHLEGEKKKEWLERAKVFFLPSYSEAMPMSILEAMGCGLPIVASNVGGIPSIVRNNINGFTFIQMCIRDSNDRKWNEGYQEAKRYFDAHGDLNVPAEYVSPGGYNLGNWVKRQRYTRQNPEKSGAVLTEERIAKLDAIGMRWGKSNSKHPSKPVSYTHLDVYKRQQEQ